MQVYLVGGAVRDTLLGLPVKERDYVVVGATPEEMVARGFKPVGRDFPVFLHPITHEEYALARTERKTGHGYLGFTCYTSPEISLEEDLLRRDLTINAMAMDQNGTLIDPYGGQSDLYHGVLRHVSPAFAEDPVRILRLARFAARFVGFVVAPDTMQLVRKMVSNGEVNTLVAERVLQEFFKALSATNVGRFLEVLKKVDALSVLFPEFDSHYLRLMELLKCDRFVTERDCLVRFSGLVAKLTNVEFRNLWLRYKFSRHYYLAGKIAITLGEKLAVPAAIWFNQALLLLESLDSFRRPELVKAAIKGVMLTCTNQQDFLRQRLSYLESVLARVWLIRLTSKEIAATADKKLLGKLLRRKRWHWLSNSLLLDMRKTMGV